MVNNVTNNNEVTMMNAQIRFAKTAVDCPNDQLKWGDKKIFYINLPV